MAWRLVCRADYDRIEGLVPLPMEVVDDVKRWSAVPGEAASLLLGIGMPWLAMEWSRFNFTGFSSFTAFSSFDGTGMAREFGIRWRIHGPHEACGTGWMR